MVERTNHGMARRDAVGAASHDRAGRMSHGVSRFVVRFRGGREVAAARGDCVGRAGSRVGGRNVGLRDVCVRLRLGGVGRGDAAAQTPQSRPRRGRRRRALDGAGAAVLAGTSLHGRFGHVADKVAADFPSAALCPVARVSRPARINLARPEFEDHGESFAFLAAELFPGTGRLLLRRSNLLETAVESAADLESRRRRGDDARGQRFDLHISSERRGGIRQRSRLARFHGGAIHLAFVGRGTLERKRGAAPWTARRAFDLALLRGYNMFIDSQWFNDLGSMPPIQRRMGERFAARADTYAWIRAHTPVNAVVEANPDTVAYFYGLYAERPALAIGGECDGYSNHAYDCYNTKLVVRPLFSGEARLSAFPEACRDFPLDYVVIADNDPVWLMHDSWIHHVQPVYSTEFTRVFSCK